MQHEEGGLELSRFVAASLRIDHFHHVAKVLLILLSEKALVRPDRLRRPGVLILPDPADADLTDDLQARALQLEVEARRSENSRTVLEDVDERAREQDIGGTRTALWMLGQWFGAVSETWATPEEAAQAAIRWSARFPDDQLLAANLAAMQLRAGQLGEAKASLARARHMGLDDALYSRLLGNVAWEENDPARALEHYQRAAGWPSALAWQIGDCFAALGQPKPALRAYRRSLRHDPFRVPAAEHARTVAGWPLLLPTFPPGWRLALWVAMRRAPRPMRPLLALWRRLRPEDPYLAPWAARNALLRGDIRSADRWSVYATRFAQTNRLIAHLDQLVVLGLMKHPDAEQWADVTARHLDWLEEHGLPVTKDAALAVRDLFTEIKYLDTQPELQQDAVVALVIRAARLSEPSSPPIPRD